MNLRYESLSYEDRMEDNAIAEEIGLVFNRQQKYDLKRARRGMK